MKRTAKQVISLFCTLALLAGTAFFGTVTASADGNSGPVSYYGQLQTRGSSIIGSKTGSAAQVKGMSFFWSNWSAGYWNAATVDRMVDEFDCEILRCAYGVNDSGTPYDTGTLNNLRAVVERCIERDVYVIIDWHTHGAHLNPSAAVSFFGEMARDYGSYDNVIFEVYNEPTSVSWSTVKSYAETVIPAIRQYSDNLIVVGCPTWSQDVDACANNPINDSNVAYTLHFYAGTHGDYLRQKAEYAMNKGYALFVTEWGSVNADGNGAIDYASTSQWLNWMDAKGLSWCNWAINDKNETSSIFYSDGTYREAGGYLNSILTDWSARAPWRNASSSSTGSGSSSVSEGVVQAESYDYMSGVETESCSEGGTNVGYIDAGDWMSYNSVSIPSSGWYTVSFRVASENGGGVLQLEQNSGADVLAVVDVPATGGWQNWTTVTADVYLNAGIQGFGIGVPSGGFNLNWFSFEEKASASASYSVTVEAEDYSYMSGIETETCNEGGYNVGYIDAGDWMSYDLSVEQSGWYTVSFRVASENGGGVLQLEQNSGADVLAVVSVPSTGGWQNWTTVTAEVYLNAGTQGFGIGVPSGGFNLNWICFTCNN